MLVWGSDANHTDRQKDYAKLPGRCSSDVPSLKLRDGMELPSLAQPGKQQLWPPPPCPNRNFIGEYVPRPQLCHNDISPAVASPQNAASTAPPQAPAPLPPASPVDQQYCHCRYQPWNHRYRVSTHTLHHQFRNQSLLLSTIFPLLVVLLLVLPSPSPLLLPAVRADLTRYYGNITYPLDEQLSYCETLGEMYDGIGVDLRLWNNSQGITREALDLAISRYTTRGQQKGMVLAFYGGVPYVVDEPKLAGLGHHVNILFTYMLVMLDLARQYGSQIPDIEFVIASSDRPLVLTAAQQPGLTPPVMRFCSSDEHAEIKIPIFHFYTKKYSHKFLAGSEELAARHPWGERQPIVFGRFSKYYRYIHPLANSTLRVGAHNKSICHQESLLTLTCAVRTHFMDWAARRHPKLLDVKSGPRVSLEKHAEYKYLLHLDGQALSSRMEQLMPLRSLILKENSGYKTFYYHLVKPYQHYIPVWQQGGGPEDVLEAVRWASLNDKEAERMAAAAQAVALKYLSKRARSCYWLKLFQAYASLQRFQPTPADKSYLRTVEEYLETVGRKFEGGNQLHKIEY